MSRSLAAAVVLSLVFLSPAHAGDTSPAGLAAHLRKLEEQRDHYEVMLRDARTETAAKYFVERLAEVSQARQSTRRLQAAVTQAAKAPAALLKRADAWLRSRIGKRVAERGMSLTDAIAWTRRELPEEFIAALTGMFHGRQPVAPRLARALWQERPRAGRLRAGYGSGTFVVQPTGPKPPRTWRKLHESLHELEDAKDAPPKPPTRDQWWARASQAERTGWVLAYFVENSSLFEVAGEDDAQPCPTCRGSGHERRRHATGEEYGFLCTRCAGVGSDKALRYR